MGNGTRDRTHDHKRAVAKTSAPDRSQTSFVDFEVLADQLNATIEEIEDALSQRYQINIPVRIPLSVDVGGDTRVGALAWKKMGTPMMSICVEFTQPKTGVFQDERVSHAPSHWRCAAVKALPQLMSAIDDEHAAAHERMHDAVQAAAAFLESLR